MDTRDAYDEWAERYDADANRTRDLDRDVTRRLLGGRRFDAILEIGCGTGKNTPFYASIGARVLAVDFSQGMLARARANAAAPNVAFASADVTAPWAFAGAGPDVGRFDLVAFNLVLEHVADLGHAFREAARALAPGGQVWISELHPYKQYGGSGARFERGAERVAIPVTVHHLSEFLGAAQAAGFTLRTLEEHWHADDAGKPPRLAVFLFERAPGAPAAAPAGGAR